MEFSLCQAMPSQCECDVWWWEELIDIVIKLLLSWPSWFNGSVSTHTISLGNFVYKHNHCGRLTRCFSLYDQILIWSSYLPCIYCCTSHHVISAVQARLLKQGTIGIGYDIARALDCKLCCWALSTLAFSWRLKHIVLSGSERRLASAYNTRRLTYLHNKRACFIGG